ncbi:hypothetical protein HK100_006247 [Physocladia obscura]|uniref:Uncharacterized protein n=1 Tax=Physocladia obscura TaxID=109957 RepID=A0AAD5SQN8_9FUNG|nr:hypothetical protein HK100_006247 [Physocladia obscura]
MAKRKESYLSDVEKILENATAPAAENDASTFNIQPETFLLEKLDENHPHI